MSGMLLSAAVLVATLAADLPTGVVMDQVVCAADASQSYALYLPSHYTPARAWPVIVAFDPGGRGRTPVERFQAAAEQYGFVIAGSNNSRNGPSDLSRIVPALLTDVSTRVHVDEMRVYTQGMSGGARVAMEVALASPKIAGVIASSAGFPDGQARKTAPFPIFATAGTEDFNHLEMRTLDRTLTSPHRLVIFEGGHQLLSSDLAVQAVEWMEIQAMRKGLKPRDEAEIDRIFAKRQAAAASARSSLDADIELHAITDDFVGLRDVTSFAARAATLDKQKDVRDALAKGRDEDARELEILTEVKTNEAQLDSPVDRIAALDQLKERWKTLAAQANKASDTPERRMARRLLAALGASVTSGDSDYLKVVGQYRRSGR
jgi:poly(3-hydroxybutyrate) depolymerase